MISISNHSKLQLPVPVDVAFQGETGAYSEIAILEKIENGMPIPRRSFKDVFGFVTNQPESYGLIPVSNSIAGEVDGIRILLEHFKPKIVGKFLIPIDHCLIVNKGVKKIKAVYSHIQALKQCKDYIEERKYSQVPCRDTAGAVKMIRELEILDAGAIASQVAARKYDMDILATDLTMKNNITTFYLIK